MSLKQKNNSGISTLSDIQTVLFKVLEDLKENKIDIDKAKIMCDVSQTLLYSARIELTYALQLKDIGQIKMLEAKKGSNLVASGKPKLTDNDSE